jgi:hypothetical protein
MATIGGRILALLLVSIYVWFGDLITANDGYETNPVQKDGSRADESHRHFLYLRVLVLNTSASDCFDWEQEHHIIRERQPSPHAANTNSEG